MTGVAQKGSKMQPGLLKARQRRSAGRNRVVTDWIWLCLGGLLQRLLRYRTLLDADERLAVGAVDYYTQPVRPASAIPLRGCPLITVSKSTAGLAAS